LKSPGDENLENDAASVFLVLREIALPLLCRDEPVLVSIPLQKYACSKSKQDKEKGKQCAQERESKWARETARAPTRATFTRERARESKRESQKGTEKARERDRECVCEREEVSE